MSVDLLAETPVYKLWCIDTRRESRKWLSSTFRLAQRLGTSTPRTFAVLSSSFLWWQPKMEVEVGVVAHGRRKSCIPRAFAPLLVQILRTGRSSKKRINRPHMATKKAHHVRKCVPRYIIDLDLPPEERWNQVVDDYKEKWLAVDKYAEDLVRTVIGPTLGPAVDAIIRRTLKSLVGRAHYSLEMKAIAERSQMDLGRLVLLQHIYEASACCTSIVFDDADVPIHVRCMDWEMDVLKPLTIEIDCRKNGETVFLASTWAGYLGAFTGMRPGQWSCSLNFRVTSEGSFWKNLKSAMKGSWPSGFLIRHLLETETTYDGAVQSLSNTALVAPCYFTVCGIAPGEGALITRSATAEHNRWLLSERGTIVQCNMDHWSNDPAEDVMQSIERRELAHQQLEKRPKRASDEWIWQMLSQYPILNEVTIYGTLMIPSRRQLVTVIPDDRHGYVPRRYSDTEGVRLVPARASYAEFLDIVTVPPIPTIACTVCNVEYGPYNNPKGECAHAGAWHATLSDCNYAACGAGLFPSNIGKQHWSCCYSTNSTSTTCSKSHRHQPPLVAEEDPE